MKFSLENEHFLEKGAFVTEFSLGCSIYVEFIHVGVSGKNQGLKFYLWSSAVVNKWWYQVCFETDHT